MARLWLPCVALGILHAMSQPTETSSRHTPSTPLIATALCASIAFALWPHLGTLHYVPMSLDGALWITRGSLHNPDWMEWVFRTQHFSVGYRPVNALTFTLNSGIGGFNPFVYRVTDLGLHALNGVLVFHLARRLAPALPIFSAWLCALLFLAHPATEEIVPFLSRRSYSLATFLSLSGVLMCLRSLGPASGGASVWRWRAASAMCFAASVLSMEALYATVAVLPLLAIFVASQERLEVAGPARAVAAPLAAAIAALVLRTAVIGGLGGYDAEPIDGNRSWESFQATWRSLGAFCVPYSDGECASAATRALPLGLAAFALAAAAIGRSLVALKTSVPHLASAAGGKADGRATAWSREPLRAGLLGLWLIGVTMLLASQEVWFPRQLYAPLLPFSLLVGTLVGEAFHGHDSSPARRWLKVAAPAALLVLSLWDSASLRGPKATRIESWASDQALMDRLESRVANLSSPTLIWLATPYSARTTVSNPLRARVGAPTSPRRAKLPARWLAALAREHGHAIEDLAVFPYSVAEAVHYRRLEGRPALFLPPAAGVGMRKGVSGSERVEGGHRRIWLDRLPNSNALPNTVLIDDGTQTLQIEIDDVRR